MATSIAVFVAGVAWMVPMFTSSQRTSCAALSVDLRGLSTSWTSSTPVRGASRFGTSGSVINSVVTLQEVTVVGDVAEHDGGRNGPRRKLVADIEGRTMGAPFYPDRFWHVGPVRGGGEVRVQVRKGLLGRWWAHDIAAP
jgi:hypothetical protein